MIMGSPEQSVESQHSYFPNDITWCKTWAHSKSEQVGQNARKESFVAKADLLFLFANEMK